MRAEALAVLRCVAGLTALLLMMGTSCGTLRTVGYRFALVPCPDSSFALIRETTFGHDYVTADVARPYRAPKGSGYTTYALNDTIDRSSSAAYHVAVRLSQTEPCTLDLAATEFLSDTSNKRLTDGFIQRRAERVVRALLDATPVRATFPAVHAEVFRSLKDWSRHHNGQPVY